jgi:DNA repair exonuclease SbcCD ATPase subunit
MKNLPSFKDFSKYEPILETADSDFRLRVAALEKGEPYHTLNEGKLLNSIKNTVSKYFLGSFSLIKMIDEARKILVDLEIEAIEKKAEFEESINKINDQIDEIRGGMDRPKLIALSKDRDAKEKEFETYNKAQSMKIKKAKSVISDMVRKNARLKEYYEAGRSEDEIGLAELEYKMAKDKADSSELKKYTDAINQKKKEAEEKADQLKKEMEEKEKQAKEEPAKDIEKVDADKEKKKISTRKGKDIIERKNQLEKDIADLRSEMEKKLKAFESKFTKMNGKIGKAYLEKTKIELLELATSLDSKVNLLKLFRGLGKTEKDIENKIETEQAFTKLTNLINQGVADGADAKSGTKKIISDVFVTPSGQIDLGKIKSAIEKLND